ncbi:hypothetical protein [Nocardioides daphniae]|uniref:hypothetical protein n=1 Tax=Nocardioides daphniae TaxID=402297 RepID=UPI0030B8112E
MVHADPGLEQLRQGLAEARPEPEAAEALVELVGLRRLAQRLEQGGGVLDRGGLGEVHDVDG